MSDPIIHVYHDHVADDPFERRRNDNARTTWVGDNVELLPFVATRTARDIGDPRPLAFIKDIFDHACGRAGEDDIVVWTNLDACLMPGTYDMVRKHLVSHEACFTGRMDVEDASHPPKECEIAFSEGSPGTDLFAFRPRWWRRVHRDMFDALIACEGFDAALVKIIQRDCHGGGNFRRSIYHQYHGQATWESQPNNPANRHNNHLSARFGRGIGLLVRPATRADGLFEVDWGGPARWGRTEAKLSFDGQLKPCVRECYVETGIGAGHSLKAALAAGFKRCIAIECDDAVANRASETFGSDAEVWVGDSGVLMPKLLGPLNVIHPDVPTTFFLDAHLSATGNAAVCPLMDELRAIMAAPWSVRPVIIIDDSDCFVPERWAMRQFTFNPRDWPTIRQIRELLAGYEIIERGTMFVCTPKGSCAA